MKVLKVILLILISVCIFSSCAENNIYIDKGVWRGKLPHSKVFSLILEIQSFDGDKYNYRIKNNSKSLFEKSFHLTNNTFQFQFKNEISFIGSWDQENKTFNVFAESGFLVHRIPFIKNGLNTYKGVWNLLIVDELVPPSVYLQIDTTKTKEFEILQLFGDRRFNGIWPYDFKQNKNSIGFRDLKTGVQFEANFSRDEIELISSLATQKVNEISLRKTTANSYYTYNYPTSSPDYEKPVAENDGLMTESLNGNEVNLNRLNALIDSINVGAVTETHSILIAKSGKLVYEEYFSGFNKDILHDQRSASKSISSAILGIAIDNGLITNINEKLANLLPDKYNYVFKSDNIKSKIDLQSLLTMSSGIDAIDFGTNKLSTASEDIYQLSDNWLTTVLESKMIHKPNMKSYYGSANAFLVGIALQSVIDYPIELYMDKYLMQPLGINNYITQNDDTGNFYLAGGMYLRPRDMLKFGQLYLNKGNWNGVQIISKDWVKKSLTEYTKLENSDDNSGYGYYWWHHFYKIGESNIEAWEARGAGGQLISIIPEYELVIVVTSGNFNNGRYWQSQAIVKDFILPAMLNQ